ncbi:MAG: alpha/beta hydrolase [Campylobacterota bacterium]|nr:alpha/beta hydrolase [Campylobacterota bacterium]
MALKSIVYDGCSYDISYEVINPASKKDIAILHGWGSNKELMRGSFETTLTDFRHIYIDMPGFGGSSNESILHTSDYAAIIKLFLEAVKFRGEVILGHSFGGKVATLLNPKLLVLVASSGILVPKSLSVKVKITLFKFFKLIGLERFRSVFVAADAATLSPGMYETFKNVVNEDFTESFATFKGKALLCFGDADTATPLYTAYEIQKLMNNARVVEFDGDHYFFMNAPNNLHVNDEILKSLKEMEN